MITAFLGSVIAGVCVLIATRNAKSKGVFTESDARKNGKSTVASSHAGNTISDGGTDGPPIRVIAGIDRRGTSAYGGGAMDYRG